MKTWLINGKWLLAAESEIMARNLALIKYGVVESVTPQGSFTLTWSE